MSQRTKFTLNAFHNAGATIRSIKSAFGNNSYNEEAGIGILDFWSEGQIISATLLKRVPTFLNEYDVKNKAFEKRNVFIFQKVHFEIDIALSILYTIGSSSNLSLLKGFLKSIINEKIIISSITTPPFEVYTMLKKSKVKFQISNVSIEQFDYNGAIGKFAAKITNTLMIKEIINNYKDQFSKIVFDIQYLDQTFSAHVYPNGIIGIITEVENENEQFYYLKQILFK